MLKQNKETSIQLHETASSTHSKQGRLFALTTRQVILRPLVQASERLPVSGVPWSYAITPSGERGRVTKTTTRQMHTGGFLFMQPKPDAGSVISASDNTPVFACRARQQKLLMIIMMSHSPCHRASEETVAVRGASNRTDRGKC